MGPRQCPDGKRAPEGSVYLSDCGDTVYFATVIAVILCVFILVFCIYCVYDWFTFQGTYQVVHYPPAREVRCVPARPCPAPTVPSFVYYESTRCNGQAAPYPNRVYQAPIV